MIMKKISLIILLISPVLIFGQVISDSLQKAPDYVQDGAFTKDHNLNKQASFSYPDIHEKDIVWSRTIWREIDLRQKINHHFYFPAIEKPRNLDPEKMSLIDVVMEALQQNARNQLNNAGGGASVMSNSNANRLDCFKTGMIKIPGKEFDWGIMSPNEVLSIGSQEAEPVALVKEDGSGDDSLDVNGDPVYVMSEVEAFDRRLVVRWKVKEEIFFDKKRSVMDTRIIGLCPVVEDYLDPRTGNVIPEYELFWIYYPDFRDILLNTKVSNFTKNNAQERSFLGVFEKRMFASRIIMESNIMNRSISDYMIGLDALLESERIQEEIFNIEHDMWEY